MAATWATCSVRMTGPAEDGTIFIYLNDVGGTFSAWFSATPGMKKEMLATALAAVSTGKTVTVHLSDTAAYSVINRMYIIA